MSQKLSNISKNVSGWRRLPRAIKCSLKGYRAAWKFESGFRQYTVVSVLLIPASFYLMQSSTHWLVLIASLILILVSEILNSAIEAIADAVKPEYNELIGRGKDLGSAAVFTSVLFAILVWLLALYDFFIG